MNLQATELCSFVPSQDFELSKAFYAALGCELTWADDNLALFALAGSKFYVQRYYVKDWAENCMLHISVKDAAACHVAITEVLATGRFPTARVSAPKAEPYGALVTYVWDPCGVLLHLAQWDAE
ncbi:hypothetical protein F3N42_14870 [Marinihelvus fidelis]|uniref:Glyoxalase n=1 Tax=Marinihelvus fidelis TaxID=2613842 RepID=A0A5N0T583_9GAMM|nr:hypothetical protein [Marinihelvus fidelis]KAA9129644.1 hypothetical protein F3N42_14870 [Marinihelvus fidelis]